MTGGFKFGPEYLEQRQRESWERHLAALEDDWHRRFRVFFDDHSVKRRSWWQCPLLRIHRASIRFVVGPTGKPEPVCVRGCDTARIVDVVTAAVAAILDERVEKHRQDWANRRK